MSWLTPLTFAVPTAVLAVAVVTAGFVRPAAPPEASSAPVFTVQFPQLPVASRPIVARPLPPAVQQSEADAKAAMAVWWPPPARKAAPPRYKPHRWRIHPIPTPDAGDDAARLMRNELEAMR